VSSRVARKARDRICAHHSLSDPESNPALTSADLSTEESESLRGLRSFATNAEPHPLQNRERTTKTASLKC